MSFEVGTRLGDYEIIQVLGEGGMGKVYKVRNVISDRVEAVKVLLPNLESNPDLANRFMREIKVQASLAHPNIAALHTAQRVGNQLLMIMEFVEGRSLDSLLAEQGRIPLAKAVAYISQVLEALAYAHAHGVVHRDIKPANMMLTSSGVVKLMDFGIARAAADRKLTQTGTTVGSLYYMSPEQIQGAEDLDARADLYSLGITLYELVTGQRPFNGNSDYSIMAAHLQAQPVPPIQLDPRMPGMLSDIILMAIAKEAGQRFQTADAFRLALQNMAKDAPTMPRAAAAAAAAIPPIPMAPPPPPPPVAYSAPAPVVAAQTTGSGRWLYIGAGSLVTVAALALVLTQAPKFFATKANTPPVEKTSTPIVSDTKPSTLTTSPTPTIKVPSVPTTMHSGTTGSTPPPAADLRPGLNKPNVEPSHSVVVAQQNQPSTLPSQAPPAQTTTNPAIQVPVALPPPITSTVDPTRAAALEKLRERVEEIHARLGSVTGSLQSLANSMQAMGLTPNPVLTDSLQRAQRFMTQAEYSLRQGDQAKTEENLANAERSIASLENKLQR